eukprot:scaffold144964_cov136-Phaeocystis_antarctica.AAC.1
MCGGPPDHARASGGTLPQQILETRTSPGRGSALRLQCSPCPEWSGGSTLAAPTCAARTARSTV